MRDFASATAVEMLGALSLGELSAAELTRSCLDRIATVNPAVGAVLASDARRAQPGRGN